jgi:hypothetical protein
MVAGLLSFGCTVDRSSDADSAGYYFTGTVYDGLEGKPVEGYSISVAQGVSTVDGSVNADTGTFNIGPIKPGSDYVITIKADGYRSFFAAQKFADTTDFPDDTVGNQLNQYYEAYLFPEDLESPAVTLDLYSDDSLTERPNGSVRFTPTVDGVSALDLSRTASSVAGQTWANDADLKTRTKTFELKDGEVKVEAAALVYGVAYTVTVYDVEGQQYKSFAFTAGIDGDKTVRLSNLETSALELLGSSFDDGSYSSESATVTYTFNQPIAFASATPKAKAEELLDEGITLKTKDYDDPTDGLDGVLPTLLDYADDEDGRGTTITIEDNILTISWPKSNHFDEANYDEDSVAHLENELIGVTYDLTGIGIRAVNGTSNDAEELSKFTNDAVTVYFSEQ